MKQDALNILLDKENIDISREADDMLNFFKHRLLAQTTIHEIKRSISTYLETLSKKEDAKIQALCCQTNMLIHLCALLRSREKDPEKLTQNILDILDTKEEGSDLYLQNKVLANSVKVIYQNYKRQHYCMLHDDDLLNYSAWI